MAVENEQLRVCVVGAGKRFLSGISYYTLHLTNVLTQSYTVSAILMRRLLPAALYPGRKRVGANLTLLEYDPAVHVFDGVDWYWIPSMLRVLAFLFRERPHVLVLQWWSGTVLHSYLLMGLVARLLGAKVVIEFHEVLDTAEARLPLAQIYVRLLAPLIVRLAHGFVSHSEYDQKLLQKHYSLKRRPIALIPHGPYNHHLLTDQKRKDQNAIMPKCYNLLFFGVIRPFKGLEDLICAFDALPQEEISKYRLTIVGETWEGWSLPADLVAGSRYRDRITFVNRYVSDAEVARFFAEADAVVLPYHRSSTSGPLHIAMSCGLPVVVTRVGGLIEAVTGYEGAMLVPPGDTHALQNALMEVTNLCGRRYADPHSWDNTVTLYGALFDTLGLSGNLAGQKSKELASVASHTHRQEVSWPSARDSRQS